MSLTRSCRHQILFSCLQRHLICRSQHQKWKCLPFHQLTKRLLVNITQLKKLYLPHHKWAGAVAAAKSKAEDEDDDVTRALLAAAAGVTYTRVQGPDGKEKVLASITKPPLTPVVTQSSKKSKLTDLNTDTEVNKVTQTTILPPVPPTIYRSASTTTNDQVYKKKKYIRTAAGATWEDPTLVEWDPNDFRLFCGDLGNEVTDDTLARAFNRYPSFQKAKVVRDKRTSKSRGYGFVSFSDPGDFTRAMREMNGKYVGNRPIKLKKSEWRNRQLEVHRKKEKEKRKLGLKN
uniref:RNA-binding protein 42 n=1 Tax=Schistosoma haematobium TaxID=6185 RepID=A0A095ASF8_SCHHA